MRNVVFLGAGRIAFRCLRRLCEAASTAGFSVRGVVSTPETILALRGPLDRVGCVVGLTNEARKSDELATFIERHEIDTLISVQHPWVIQGDILSMVANGAWNLHNAPLPRFQGHNCISHAIAEGHVHYGVSLHQMVEQVDAGPIVESLTYRIPPKATAESLYLESLRYCDEVFSRFISGLTHQKLKPAAPNGDTFYYKKSDMDSLRDVTKILDPLVKERIVRACFFPPYEPAYEVVNEGKIYLLPESAWSVMHFDHRPANSIQRERVEIGRSTGLKSSHDPEVP